ncbi:MAG: prephenate dehydrogenase [bacterium]
MFEKIAIIGIGLLGGSLARALRAAGAAGKISATGRNPDRLAYALQEKIADETKKTPLETAADADLVIVSTPVKTIPAVLEEILPALKYNAIVTDVGSTKVEITSVGDRIFPAGGPFFVGGHPMAGSEDSGVEASRGNLFENALCVLTPTERTDPGALERVKKLWEAARAKVLVMPPHRHDLLVAAASHLPHLVAVSLTKCISEIGERHEQLFPLLAGGFRDTTRIASGSPEVWRDICLTNRDPILETARGFLKVMSELTETLSSDAGENLERLFESAKSFRDAIPERGKGALFPNYEVLVDAADRPGVIGEIATSLGAAGINIKNIHVRHVRELRGGAIALTLESEKDVDRALELLKKTGFNARKKR